MKRQKITIGSILEIDLKDGYFVYAQILEHGFIFFDYRVTESLKDLILLNNKSILFIISVYNSAVNQGIWLKIGKLPIREEFIVLPMQFIQDAINPNFFSIYNPNTGEITPALKEECIGLECCAVWEAYHVEDRIRDHYLGKPNIWLEQLVIK